jgi:DNA-binding response OmpR family regulator
MTRILVVDDEPDYPRLLDIILTREGFDVRTATNGDEAHRVAEEFAPDVLIVDWMLGGREDGLRVASALRALNPALRTVLITGYPSMPPEPRIDGTVSIRFLPKPFTPPQLVELVREVIRLE